MEMTEIVCNIRESFRLQSPARCNNNNNVNRAEDDKTFRKIVHKLKRLYDSAVLGDKTSPRSSVIEADFEQDRFLDKIDQHIPGLNNYGSFEDASEYQLCQNITIQLQQLLMEVGKQYLNCQLLAPSDLSSRIAQDVLRMSQNEPCGIKGCIIFINLEEKSIGHKLGKIECDPTTVATFELHLTLKEDTRPWVIAKNMLVTFKGCLVDGKKSPIKVLCAGFQLAKKKLYRPN